MQVLNSNSNSRPRWQPLDVRMKGGDPGFDIVQLIGPIRRRIRLILSTFAIVLMLAALALLAITPRYTASALIQIDPSTKNLLDTTLSQANFGAENTRVESEVGILRSQAILLSVVKQNQLVLDAEFATTGNWINALLLKLRLGAPQPLSEQEQTQQTLERFARHVAVNRVGATYLISVDVQSRDPNKAATLANAIAATYIRAQVETKITSILTAREVLSKRIAQASQAIQESEAEFESFIGSNLEKIAQRNGSTSLTELRDRLASARKSHERDLAAFHGLDESVRRNDWASVAESLRSEAIRQLGEQHQKVRTQIAANTGTKPINLREELARIEADLNVQTRIGNAALKQRIDQSERDIDTLRQSVRETVLQSNLPTEVLAELYQLQQGSEIARSQYQTLLSRLKEMEAQAELQIADSRIVSSALAPTKPSFPKVGLVLGLAAIGSIALGVSLAFIYENYIGGFLSEDQVASVLGVPRVFTVPLQRSSGRNEEGSLSDIIVHAPTSRYSEAVRRIWAAVEQAKRSTSRHDATAQHGAFIVMVSSALPAEGKTTLATALARNFAQEGRRTLLVDCDLRKPAVHRHTGVAVTVGLQELLSSSPGKGSDSIIMLDSKTDLRIIGGRRTTEKMPATLIAGEEFKRMLSLATKSYDFIILDSPPIEPIIDGLYLAHYADLLVFSLAWGQTPQREASSALDAISAARDRPLDLICVLNKRGDDTFDKQGYYYDP